MICFNFSIIICDPIQTEYNGGLDGVQISRISIDFDESCGIYVDVLIDFGSTQNLNENKYLCKSVDESLLIMCTIRQTNVVCVKFARWDVDFSQYSY